MASLSARKHSFGFRENNCLLCTVTHQNLSLSEGIYILSWREDPPWPDIVFTDIHLIGSASGWDVAECVRADRGAPPLNQSWRITCDRVDRELLLGTVEKPSAISAVIDFRLIFDTSWPTVRYFFRLIKLGHGGSPPTP